MSGTEFDRKARVVATAWEVLDRPPWQEEWANVIKHFDLGFPYAWMHNMGHGTLNPEGIEQVEATYNFLLKSLEVEDSEELYSFWDVLATKEKSA
jgi:hypothetical protein